MQMSNTLGIGTMGFGGGVTLIGCKVGVLNRLPASFFVSVAYSCWAFRRLGVVLDADSGGDQAMAVSRSSTRRRSRWLARAASRSPARRRCLRAPLTEEQVRDLKVGDVVVISGEMYTGRDAVHAYLMKHEPPVDLHGSVLYHCGPVVMQKRHATRSRRPGRRRASARSRIRATSSSGSACVP